MTPSERKRKAKQLSGLIEQLDIRQVARHRLAIMCLEAENPGAVQDMADTLDEVLRLINTVAMEGPLKYGGTEHRLKQPAE